jgi:hypothetical protein
MSDDDRARRLVLARRQRFVSAAMVGMTSAVIGTTQACEPAACLRLAFVADAGDEAATDASTPDADAADANVDSDAADDAATLDQ